MELAVASGNYDAVMNVSTDSSSVITVTPPANELWRIKNLQFVVPAPTGATSGYHYFLVYGLGTTNVNKAYVLRAVSAYGDEIRLACNYIQTATYATNPKKPTSEQTQQNAVLNIVATNASPLKIHYFNGTDVAQTGTYTLEVSREVEYIVS